MLTAAMVCLALFCCVLRVKGHRPSMLAILSICGVLSVMYPNLYDICADLRWLLWSRNYKAEVSAQADGRERGWKHMEWDGWGFPGAGSTVVYIVYDPSNLLAEAAKDHSPGVVLTPAARSVARVRRLEDSWYSVVFYTGTDWENGD